MSVVTGSGSMAASFSESVSAGVVTSYKVPAVVQLQTQYTNGTGAGQVDTIYSKQLTFTASTPQTLTLSSIADLAGATVSFARVRELAVQVVSGTITLGAAPTHPWAPLWGATGTDVVFAGSTRYFSDPASVGAGVGAVVVAGSSDQLQLNPGGASAVVNILIVGCSAP